MSDRLMNFAEQWIDHYRQKAGPVTYSAFDFTSIKRSLLEYLQTYHPEYFNNLIETDELLPLIEMFAYVGELYSYRADMNTQEHILFKATRKSSAIQLANMMGYTTSRRSAATGLLKIMSISTTEVLHDSLGDSLRNVPIKWNDPLNRDWQAQFHLVLNRILNNQVGIVSNTDKTSIEGILVERYATNTNPVTNGVIGFSITVNGTTMPMEIVSAELSNSTIIEDRPVGDRSMSILFLNDGLGYGSSNTGFFMMVKQGILSKYVMNFDGKTPNLVHELPVIGVNETDVFLNSVDQRDNLLTKWDEVPNVAYNNATHRNVYQIETLENDGVRLVYGDGSYSAIPSGRYNCWARVSESFDHSIPTLAITNKQISLNYYDSMGNIQTITFDVALQSPITNASQSETLDKIKSAAPGVFYTQDRMVNGQDHNNFLMQDPTIIKTKAVNRTFVGHSKYKGWYDGSEVYDNVRLFGEDGVLYYSNDVKLRTVANPSNLVPINAFIDLHVEPLLEQPDLWIFVAQRIKKVPEIRKYLTIHEKQSLEAKLRLLIRGAWIGINWNDETRVWDMNVNGNADVGNDLEIRVLDTAKGWTTATRVSRLILHSNTMKFWDYDVSSTVDYDTLSPTKDKVTVLRTNSNNERTGILHDDVVFSVVNLYTPYTNLPNQLTVDYSRVEVIGADRDGDKFPDDLFSESLFNRRFVVTVPQNTINYVVNLPETYVGSDGTFENEIKQVVNEQGNSVSYTQAAPYVVSDTITIPNTGTGGKFTVYFNDYVYFYKNPLAASSELVLAEPTAVVKEYCARKVPGYHRFVGRSHLYFLWQHFSDQYELVDPAKTNITDIYVVTKQHYNNTMLWLGATDVSIPQPAAPTYRDLQIRYAQYLAKGMISTENVLRPARFKILYGQRARSEARAKIQLVLRGASVSQLTVKQEVVELVRQYFDISRVGFGEVIYFSDVAGYITTKSKYNIGSVLLVPLFPAYSFGDLYEIRCAVDEIPVPDITTSDIEIVDNITTLNIRQ